jgi:hypothetical protein
MRAQECAKTACKPQNQKGNPGFCRIVLRAGVRATVRTTACPVCAPHSRSDQTNERLLDHDHGAEAAIGWLERNHLAEHLHLLDDDPRYAWTARKRGDWKPPVGRVGAHTAGRR